MHILIADYKQPDAAKVLSTSIKETGFGILKNHPVDFQLIAEVYAEWEIFFNSSSKWTYLYDKEKQDGFFPYLSENAKDSVHKDLKEFYHLYPWGRYPEQLTSKTRELFYQLSTLAESVLQWLEQYTPDEIKEAFSLPLSEMIHESPNNLLRILHYPPLEQAQENGALRASAHEDIDLLTLLPAATATGLQVKDRQGRWHDVASDPGTIVVNAGDMLQMCSNEYYRSTTHQVVNPTGESLKKSRFSMPLFLHPRDEVRLSPEHTAKSYLRQRLREIGVM